jgi:deoxyribonuclease-4
MTNIRIGGHVSTSGGLVEALARAESIDANCLQIFSSPPRQWKTPAIDSKNATVFKTEAKKRDLLPVYIHATYLINLASDNVETIEKSRVALKGDLEFGSAIGATGVIFHFGSHSGGWKAKRHTMTPVIQELLATTRGDTRLIIENAAGSGVKVGSTLEELSQIAQDVQSSRLAFCLDTAHAYASGYDYVSQDAAQKFSAHVAATIGWDSVPVFHVNDSKVPLGHKSDRHENIGEGCIGSIGLTHFFATVPNLESKTLLLETPGFEGTGPDKENIHLLQNIIVSLYL